MVNFKRCSQLLTCTAFLCLGYSQVSFAHSPTQCPNLAGIYDCTGDTKEFSDAGTEIRQRTTAQGVEYDLPYVAGNSNYTRLANGIQSSQIQSDQHWGKIQVISQVSCLANGELYDVLELGAPLDVQMKTTYRLSGKVLTVEVIMERANIKTPFHSECRQK